MVACQLSAVAVRRGGDVMIVCTRGFFWTCLGFGVRWPVVSVGQADSFAFFRYIALKVQLFGSLT